jgi:hypothetical protein
VYTENKAGLLQENWYDSAPIANSTKVHPTQTWVEGPTLPGMRNGSAIAAIKFNETTLIHYQSDDGTIWETIAQGLGENTTLSEPIAAGTALIGTKMSAVVLNTTEHGAEVRVFAQDTDMKIVEFIRTLTGDNWTKEIIPIGFK